MLKSLIFFVFFIFSQNASGKNYSLKICNDSQNTEIPFISFAFFDEKQNSWISRGWLPIPKQTCGIIFESIQGQIYVKFHHPHFMMDQTHQEKSKNFCYHKDKEFLIKQENCSAEEMNSQFIISEPFVLASEGKNIEKELVLRIKDNS